MQNLEVGEIANEAGERALEFVSEQADQRQISQLRVTLRNSAGEIIEGNVKRHQARHARQRWRKLAGKFIYLSFNKYNTKISNSFIFHELNDHAKY